MGLNDSNPIICCICGHEINGAYFIDPYNRPACKCHSDTQCFCCGRFCSPTKSLQVKRYGYLCPHCEVRMVKRDSAVRMAKVINDFYCQEKIKTPPYRLFLISSEEMVQRDKSNKYPPCGLATYGFNSENENGRTYIVYVLSSISRTLAASIIAHEVLHLWQYELGIEAPDDISEGFCNLGAYLFLQYIQREESLHQGEYLIKNQDPIYGQGFRNMKAIFDCGGWSMAIQHLKSYSPKG